MPASSRHQGGGEARRSNERAELSLAASSTTRKCEHGLIFEHTVSQSLIFRVQLIEWSYRADPQSSAFSLLDGFSPFRPLPARSPRHSDCTTTPHRQQVRAQRQGRVCVFASSLRVELHPRCSLCSLGDSGSCESRRSLRQTLLHCTPPPPANSSNRTDPEHTGRLTHQQHNSTRGQQQHTACLPSPQLKSPPSPPTHPPASAALPPTRSDRPPRSSDSPALCTRARLALRTPLPLPPPLSNRLIGCGTEADT